MTTDKQWVENQIRHNRNTFIISLGSCVLMNSDAVLDLDGRSIVCKSNEIIFDARPEDKVGTRHEIDMSQIVGEYKNYRTRYVESLKEFYKAQRRLAFKESFEIAKAYSDEANVSADLKSQSWYQYARVVRNSISHNFHFNFNNYDKTILPVSWGGITIDINSDGQALREDQLPPDVVINLLIEIEEFIHAH